MNDFDSGIFSEIVSNDFRLTKINSD